MGLTGDHGSGTPGHVGDHNLLDKLVNATNVWYSARVLASHPQHGTTAMKFSSSKASAYASGAYSHAGGNHPELDGWQLNGVAEVSIEAGTELTIDVYAGDNSITRIEWMYIVVLKVADATGQMQVTAPGDSWPIASRSMLTGFDYDPEVGALPLGTVSYTDNDGPAFGDEPDKILILQSGRYQLNASVFGLST